ncbi:PREDICTED: ATP-dependent DNA helicase DDX11-like isoform X2 [Amphimedon queenslandica]|uniref:Helicase ATP-binding domain-containing protein n=1 Tax=Amphimedon queenslandica TaxID=400682 RepID=A0A1X7UKI4_AMPQE|nr:PREDICTED: ATP-dependent DNA helicase DDX11-like isoform X2 [Amphimedon queenslandica]|eukprot:XP_019853718.1 PREDICTED: ATP-dependent DNA helicase DDX11-like isoform X2 [Amphimedon queenslandica]
MAAMEAPADFPFPFKPYSIQTDFMRSLYSTLEEGKVGLFESPTGTGKSLSIICGCLKWLMDHQEKETKRCEAILSGDVSVLPLSDKNEKKSVVDDWFAEYDQRKRLRDEAFKMKLAADKRKQRQERISLLKERYGTSLFSKRQATVKNEKMSITDEQVTVASSADNELLLDEYHSDDEHMEHNDSFESDCDIEDEDQTVKIFYASRTHSQLTQFVHEVKKTSYKDTVSVIPLGSRQTCCLNKSVTKLQSISLINERCIELQKNKKKSSTRDNDTVKTKRHRTVNSDGCDYYKLNNIETMRDLALDEIQDIEQLVTLGRDISGCPYYATRYAVPHAQLIVLPYNILLHSNTRDAVGIKLKGNIVIIDEAHNLIDTISSIHSVHITMHQIQKTHSQLLQYRDRYQSRLKAKNLMYIDQILFVLISFQRLLTRSSDTPNPHTSTGTINQSQQEHCELVRLNEFLLKAKIDNINMFKLLQYCKKSQIAKKLNGFAESYQRDEATIKDDIGANTSSSVVRHQGDIDRDGIRSPLMIIQQFIESLTTADQDCRIVIKQNSSSQSSLKYLLLNPSVHFTDIVKEARAVVLAGGTMQPFSDFKEQLFTGAGVPIDRFFEFSCGHVIGDDQLLPLTLSKGTSGYTFNFNYEQRQDKQMIIELGRTISNIVTIVPGGVVCFFPSYEYEKLVFNIWEKNGLLDRIANKKQIFREPKLASQAELVLSQYARCIEYNGGISVSSLTGALMSCVVGGKLSEGINFSDNLGRCVIMVGLPYPNIKSPELIEKMEYLNSTQKVDVSSKSPGQMHYDNLCMKAVNQSIGRAIRHANDYATIILIDQRYSHPSVYSKLPNWISSQLLITTSFGQSFSALRKFFLSKKNK